MREKVESWDFLDSVAVGEGTVDVGGLWAEGEVL